METLRQTSQRNRKKQLTIIKQHHTFWQNRLHVLYEPDMPLKHAGVGLARKWGMDEAVARFAHIQRPEGLIITLDADCQVAKNFIMGGIKNKITDKIMTGRRP